MGDEKGSFINIEDALGLGQGVVKLIEVVSAGIGKLYEPKNVKKLADAKAYEIGTITNAIELKGLTNYTFGYENNKVTFKSEEGKQLELQDRAIQRMISQEIKKQINTEKIINIAAEELKQVASASVSEEKVDEDWITRFFTNAADISSEEMQCIWGKILAGEIKQPNSFSLRALELVRNLSKDEADLISKIANATIYIKNEYQILKDEQYLKDKYDISFLDISLLESIGFLQTSLTYSFENKSENIAKILGTNGPLCLIMEIPPNTVKITINIYLLTKLGKEIMSILDIKSDIRILENIASKISENNNNIKYIYGIKNDHGITEIK